MDGRTDDGAGGRAEGRRTREGLAALGRARSPGSCTTRSETPKASDAYNALIDKFDSDHATTGVREILREARLVLASLHVIEGRPAEAQERLEQVLDEFPDDVSAMNDLGYLWADENRRLQRALGDGPPRRRRRAGQRGVPRQPGLGPLPPRAARRSRRRTANRRRRRARKAKSSNTSAKSLAALKKTDEADQTWRKAAEAYRKADQPDRAAKDRRPAPGTPEDKIETVAYPQPRQIRPHPHDIKSKTMSGHSHWAGIKHKKALVDAKRGKMWSKLSKAIIVAAKMGGGDPDANLRLRYAIDDAKAVSMPKDNIQRAIKKGAGELEGVNFEEVIYEGYGADGVAVLCEVLTDNRNRTAPEIRKIFELGRRQARRHRLRRVDVRLEGLLPHSDRPSRRGRADGNRPGSRRRRRPPRRQELRAHLRPGRLPKPSPRRSPTPASTPEVKEITRIPKNTVDLDADAARKILKLMERLDDHDDVQSVSANFNIPDEVMAEMGET